MRSSHPDSFDPTKPTVLDTRRHSIGAGRRLNILKAKQADAGIVEALPPLIAEQPWTGRFTKEKS